MMSLIKVNQDLTRFTNPFISDDQCVSMTNASFQMQDGGLCKGSNSAGASFDSRG